MSALDQRGTAVTRLDFTRNRAHVFERADFFRREDFRFGQVRRDQLGQRQQVFLKQSNGGGFEQPRATGSDQHWIDNQWRPPAAFEKINHHANQLA